MSLSEERKQELKKKYKEQTYIEHIMSKDRVENMFAFIEKQMKKSPCGNTLRYTGQWLSRNIPREKVSAVLNEIKKMGGYCDCEVLYNCYDEYDF